MEISEIEKAYNISFRRFPFNGKVGNTVHTAILYLFHFGEYINFIKSNIKFVSFIDSLTR